MKNKYKHRTIECVSCGITVSKRMPDGRKYCSLDCYRSGSRPSRVKRIDMSCDACGADICRVPSQINKNNFCSRKCANSYQSQCKLVFVCKTCQGEFKWSKSRLSQANPTYCSMMCRNKDTTHMRNCGLQSTLVQQKKNGLNKLELAGREILRRVGVEFEEQVLMFDKFLVDVLIESKKIIIQWDGEYWHTKPKRKQLDKSQDAYMNKCGYSVLRITDKKIKNNSRDVYENIKRAIQ